MTENENESQEKNSETNGKTGQENEGKKPPPCELSDEELAELEESILPDDPIKSKSNGNGRQKTANKTNSKKKEAGYIDDFTSVHVYENIDGEHIHHVVYDKKGKRHNVRIEMHGENVRYRSIGPTGRLYNYSKLKEAKTVFFVNGEAEADALTEVGLVSTCLCPSGWFLAPNSLDNKPVFLIHISPSQALNISKILSGKFSVKKIILHGIGTGGEEKLSPVLNWIEKQKSDGLGKDEIKKNLLALTDEAVNIDTEYFVNEKGFVCFEKWGKDGPVITQICNFQASICTETIFDNGIEEELRYVLTGQTNNGPLPKIDISTKNFQSLDWLHKWGNNAVIEPGGYSTKDRVRHYIQVNSSNVKKTVCYTHTGWRKADGKWVYLTSSGGIGAENVEVTLSPELKRYSLPLKTQHENEAIKASLEFLDIGDRNITLPLWSLLVLAPLTTLLDPMPTFSGYLYGETGTFKSTFATLLLSHFGNFNSVSNLSNFDDTANALEHRSFTLKDTLMVLDDFHPSHKKIKAEEMECKAQRLIRSFSNRTGRGRLNSDASEKSRYGPRGMLLITGEEFVSLQSTQARTMLVELRKGMIDHAKLSALQKRTWLFPHAMSSYVHWVKDNIDMIQERFKNDFTELRCRATMEEVHSKLPEQSAFLMFGLGMAIEWIKSRGVMTNEGGVALAKEGWGIFLSSSARQNKIIAQEDPVKKFIDLVNSMLLQGFARVEHKVLRESDAKIGEFIGWYDDDFYYFLPTALWHTLKNYCARESAHFPMSEKSTIDMLVNKNIIEPGQGRVTKQMRLSNGSRVWVLKTKKGLFAPQAEEGEDA